MSADQNNYLGDSIPLEPEHEETSSARRTAANDDIFATPAQKPAPQPASKIRMFDSSSLPGQHETAYKRTPNLTGKGATRVRTFHAKLSDGAMHYLDEQINDWLDNHPEIEVKFCNTTVGVVQGKTAEPHLIITVWF